MRYWWVNQNQTFQQEIAGGYLWSPKRKSNGKINPFYEFMRIVEPGDIIFSFEGTYIRAIGIVHSNAYPCPKPTEFGRTGPNWDAIGWRVDTRFEILVNQVRPVDIINAIRPTLPVRYSPLQETGRGNQGVYLAPVPPAMAAVLVTHIGTEAGRLEQIAYQVSEPTAGDQSRVSSAVGLAEWEEHLIKTIGDDSSLSLTEREAVILARRGQGEFKLNVMQIESQCRITKVDRIEHLRASHIKPWRDCASAEERLAPTNGLLLTPTIDHLFDRGFISFENNGRLLISPAANLPSLEKMGVPSDRHLSVGYFSEEQKHFLEYHREEVFLAAKIST